MRKAFVIAIIAGVIGIAAANPAAGAEARLNCGDGAAHWDKNIVACPADGKAYPETKDGWRDGVVVDLSGFTYSENKNGFPLTAIDHWWFTPDGTLLRDKKAVIVPIDGKNASTTIRPNDGFRGRMITQPAQIIEPGRYKILFQAHVHCDPPGNASCNSNIRQIHLPGGFNVVPGVSPFNLVNDSGWIRSEFAWTKIEILGGERPGLDPVGFSLICQPLGTPCYAGSPF